MFADVETLERAVNEQLLSFDYHKHYGTGKANYKFRVKLEDIEDYEKNALVIREALNSGIPVKKSEAYFKLGLTQPNPNDDIFTATQIY